MGLAVPAECLNGGKLQHGIGGDSGGGDAVDGVGVTHLCLADAQEGLFIAMSLLDIPSPDVLLNDGLQGEGGISADQVGGLSVEALGADFFEIRDRSNDHEAQIEFFARRFPSKRCESFDLEDPLLPCGIGADLLVGDGGIDSKFFGSGGLFAVDSLAAPARLFFGQEIEVSIFSDPADEHRVGRKPFQDLAVGIAAVDEHVQRVGFAVGAGALELELMKPLDSAFIEIGLFHGFAIAIPLLGGSVFTGFAGGGGIGVINRHHADLALVCGHCGGEFDKPLSPDQVDVKRGPQGVFAISGTWNALSCFAQDGVVQCDHQGVGRMAEGFEFFANL